MIPEKRQMVENIGRGLFNFWIIACCFFFFFIGALQEKHQFENTLVPEVNKTLGMAGSAAIGTFMKEGASRPTFWLIFFPIVLILNFYFNVYSVIKDEKKTYIQAVRQQKGGTTLEK